MIKIVLNQSTVFIIIKSVPASVAFVNGQVLTTIGKLDSVVCTQIAANKHIHNFCVVADILFIM